MKNSTTPNFSLFKMIKVSKNHDSLETSLNNTIRFFIKKNFLFLLVLLYNTSLVAQAPNISYTGVQPTYSINNPITPLNPINVGGLPIVRTNVTTIAGNGTSGFSDGSTSSPKFYSPTGIAIAISGNMYVADSQNHCIRKITSSGFVSTFAGSGTAGFNNGAAEVAQFNIPYSIAVDASENVYVTESNSSAIRKITPAGVVSTFAGNVSTSGFLDGIGSIALFSSPRGLGVDGAGNVYVADSNNNRIRKITSSGVVTTIAGDGTANYLDAQGTLAKFNNPIGVAVTSSGVVYVSDASNNRIRVISSTGLVSTIAGSGTPGIVNGQGTLAQFNTPRAIAIDSSENIYVVDYINNRIRKITNTGIVSTLSGTGAFGSANGEGTVASFKYPEGIALDASGNAYVADVTNNTIRRITSTGDTSTYVGTSVRGLENGQSGVMAMFNSPVAVAVTSSGITYVIDDFNSCVRKVTSNGIVSTLAGNTTTGYADGQGVTAFFNNPKGLAVDSAGNIYVADTFNNRIRKITSSGVVTTIAGDGTAGFLDGQGTAAKFNNPYSLTLDNLGNIYVADTKNHRIRKISTTGLVTTVAGFILQGYVDGASTVARFRNPQGITIDRATGILYVADTNNHRIRRIATDGTVSTLAGSFAGYTDDLGVAANFNSPIGITIDNSGNLYIGDYFNSVIRKVSSTGLVSTFAGDGSSQHMDGFGNVSSFYFPVGVTLDSTGNVYVADSYTQRIRKISSVEPYTISPALPIGIAFNFSNGELSGTPTEVKASTTYTISASNYSGTDTTTITFATGTVASPPSPPTATSQTFCNSATVANLVATGTSLRWYNVATGGTALASTTALATGNYFVSQTVNSIESARTTVSVIVNITPIPTALSQSFCNSPTVANLVASGTALRWYTVATGGTALASTTTLATGNYFVSQTLNSCESSRTLVSVTINTTAAPNASAQTFNNAATVANLVASGTALRWYTVATGGTALASTTALVTGSYFVSQTVNLCESLRTLVSVTINSAPGAPTASAQTFCNSATVANLVATGTALQWYTVATGGTSLGSTTALATGNYFVSQTVNSIESARTTVSVTVNITPTPSASSQSFCNSATVVNLVATGTALRWYTVATGGTSLTSTTALVTGNYFVSQTVNSCESLRTLVFVTINTTTAPTASAQTFNNAATVANLVATGTALRWYTVATGGTALASTTLLSTGNYFVSQTVNSCESLRTLVSVTINSAPGAPMASAQTFCNSATVANLVATGTALQWYTVATGGTDLASTTALATGNYFVSQTVNSIESARTTVSVTVNITPAPTASAQTFNNSATVANLVATGTALQWYTVATGGTPLASTTLLSTGTYYVTQTLNSCESTRTLVSITINSAPGSPTASAQTFCNSATVANLVATGTALQWYSVATGGTALPSTTALSTGNYYVSQTVNTIESARTTVSVTVNITPAPSAAWQTFCNSATVANLVAAGTELRWYTVTNGGTALSTTTALMSANYYVSQTLNSCESIRVLVIVSIRNTAAPTASAQTFNNNATVSNLVANGTDLKWYNTATGGNALATTTALSTGNYYVSQTLNSCESPRTVVSVTINLAPGAPTAFSQTFCNAATVANLIATGSALQWYNVAIGGTPLVSTTALTTGNYYVSQIVNSIESARTAIAVTINVTPPPSALPQAFCNTATISDLVAVGTGLKWYNLINGGTALVPSTGLVTGNFFVSQTLNSCESVRTLVSVTVNGTPSPTASAQSLCNAATVADLVATGSSLRWYTAATGGTVLTATTSLITGNYFVSQTLNSCESARTLVSVTVNTTPSPTASAQSFCNAANVSNLVATGSSLRWYTVATEGTALTATTSLITGNYFVSQTLNSCESARTLVSVTVNTTPSPTASAQSFCNAATVSNLVATGSSLRWYTVATAGTALTATTALITGNYFVSQTLNSCESARTLVSVTVNTTPSPTASAQVFNGSATVANLVASGTSLKWYTVSTGGTALALTTALTTGNYFVSQTLNSCESSRILVSVTVNTTTTSAPLASNQNFCNPSTVANLQATGVALRWYNVATGGTPLSSTTSLQTGNYYVSQTVNSIESPRTLVEVTIYGAPISKNITSSTSSGSNRFPICTSAIKILNIRSGYSATNLQWERAIVPLNSNIVPSSSDYVAIDGATGPSYTVTNAVAGINYFRVKFTNGNCNNTALYSTEIVYYRDCSNSRLSVVSYPNPYNENFNLSLSTPSDEKILITVYDMMGKLMQQLDTTINEVGDLKVGERFPTGIYNVVITQGDEVKTLRVIKR
jgi:sugar lactone lactonase YvrE